MKRDVEDKVKICLHIHSKHSHDCDVPVEEVITHAKKLGYNIISITDHNTIQGSIEAKKYGDNSIKIILGGEFSTQYGHVLAYFIDDSIEKNTLKLSRKQFDFYELVKNIREIGGIIILAHPFNSKLKDNMEILNDIDGIEMYNSRMDSFYWRKKSNKFISTLLDKESYIYTGGCDAHSLNELNHCFMVTEVFSLTAESFKCALLKKSVIYYKKYVNYDIAKAKIHNLKRFKLKFLVKNSIRIIFGVFERINYKTTGCEEYETICIGKKNQQKD